MRTKNRNNRRTRRGAALVEAALVLPVVLMTILGIFEYGRFFMTEQIFTNAAREGAEYASKHTEATVVSGTTYAATTAEVQTTVTSFLGGLSLGSQSISVFMSDASGDNLGTWTSAQGGNYVCCQITGTYSFMVPTLLKLPSTVSLTYQSVAPCEGN